MRLLEAARSAFVNFIKVDDLNFSRILRFGMRFH